MKTILVPVDFSDVAKKALNVAVQIAKNTNTTIHLLHSIEMQHIYYDFTEDIGAESIRQDGYSYLTAVKHKSTEILGELEKRVRSEGVECVTTIESGKPYSTILEYCENNSIQLIIMGTKGLSGLAEVVLGSNSQKIIRNAKCPVLIVKEDYDIVDFSSIVLASDFNDEAINENINYVAKLANYFKSKITLLFIATPLNFLSEEELKTKIEKVAQKTNLQNYSIVISKAESAEEGIMEYCQLENPGVFAITTHGKGFFRKLFLSNTTEYLANHLSTPLLSMPISYNDN